MCFIVMLIIIIFVLEGWKNSPGEAIAKEGIHTKYVHRWNCNTDTHNDKENTFKGV